MMQGWLYLAASIFFEVIGTYAIKQSDGMTRLWPSAVLIVAFALSFWLFSLATRTLALGVAYAVWSGVATAVITIIGVVFFRDAMTTVKVLSIVLIVAGIVGLNLSDGRT